MISLPEFKKLLGQFAQNLTDAEIELIRTAEYQIADAIFEQWIRSRKATAKPFGNGEVQLYNTKESNPASPNASAPEKPSQ